MLSVCCIFWPIYIFYLNEDYLEVEFKDFHTSKDTPFPSIALCFSRTPFNDQTQSHSNTPITKYHSPNSSKVGLLHIDDYIHSIVIYHTNKTRVQLAKKGPNIKLHQHIQQKGNFTNIILRRFESTDCLEAGTPFKENKGIQSISLKIRKDVFKKVGVPTRNEIMSGSSKLTIGMSLKGNIFRLPSHNPGEFLLPSYSNRSCSGIAFVVKEMEILRRRHKISSPCFNYEENKIFTMLRNTSKVLGCMPIDWEIPSTLPSCLETKPNELAYMHLNMQLQFMEYNYMTQACQTMTNIQTTYDFFDLRNACQFDKDTFQVTALFNKFLYKDTKTVRKYTLWNLFSDIGVIIGFFLGVSLMNVPEMTTGLGNTIRKKIFKKSVERRKSSIFIHQILGSLRDEVSEMDEKLSNVDNQFMEVQEKLRNAENDISFHKNQLMECQEKLRNAENDISLHKNQLMECTEKLKNAEKDIFLNKNAATQYKSSMIQYQEKLQNAEKDLSLIKNHMRQCAEKEECETIV